jgi:hypothetical protein
MRKLGRLPFLILYLGIIFVVQQPAAEAQSPGNKPLSSLEVNQLQAAAQAGDQTAQLNLGKAYDHGNGVPQSDPLAVKWYRAAAEQGNATAQNNLGLMFRLGRGVEQDKVEAVKWYRKAAKQENPNAMFNLGTAYYNGDGVESNIASAYAWFLLAQKAGSPPAADATKRMKQEAGNLESGALEEVGDMYQRGEELPKNSSEAINWYRKGAEKGGGQVQVKLAQLLLAASNPSSNYEEARRLCEKAASFHFPGGAYCLGLLYAHGIGVAEDLQKAAKWFIEAANMNNGPAALRLGEMYWKGQGVKQDRIAAYEFVYLASTSNLPEAQQERERMEKELTPKEMKEGKAKAVAWTRQHEPVILRGKTPTAN